MTQPESKILTFTFERLRLYRLKHFYIHFGNKKGSSIEEDVEIATDTVRNHEFFSSINFEELKEGNLESPYNPQVYFLSYYGHLVALDFNLNYWPIQAKTSKSGREYFRLGRVGKKKKIVCPLLEVFAFGQVSNSRLYWLILKFIIKLIGAFVSDETELEDISEDELGSICQREFKNFDWGPQ